MKKKNIFMILIIVIIVLVCGYTIYRHFDEEEEKYIPFNAYRDIVQDGDNFIAAGYNNYYKEDQAKYVNDEILIQGEFIKLDKNLKLIKKVNFVDDGSVLLSRVVKVDGGYVAVGIMLSDIPVKTIMIKFDNNLNVVKKDYLSELKSTIFRDFVIDNDNIIVLCSTFDIDENDEYKNEQNVIYKIDGNLNVIDKTLYNEGYDFYHIDNLDDSYLLIGGNENQKLIAKISKEDNEIIFSSTFMNANDYYYLYNNKLYANTMVYDLSNNEITKFEGEDLGDNEIVLIDNDIIYTSHVETKQDDIVNLYTYDLDMKKIKEYKLGINDIIRILKIDNKLLILGTEIDEDSGLKPVIKYIEK